MGAEIFHAVRDWSELLPGYSFHKALFLSGPFLGHSLVSFSHFQLRAWFDDQCLSPLYILNSNSRLITVRLPKKFCLLFRGFLLRFLGFSLSQLQNFPNSLGAWVPDVSYLVSCPFFSVGIWLFKSLILSLQSYKIYQNFCLFLCPQKLPSTKAPYCKHLSKITYCPQEEAAPYFHGSSLSGILTSQYCHCFSLSPIS